MASPSTSSSASVPVNKSVQSFYAEVRQPLTANAYTPSCDMCPCHHSQYFTLNGTALVPAYITAIIKPAEFSHRSGKRLEGITVFLFSQGKCLCWVNICIDIFFLKSPSLFSWEHESHQVCLSFETFPFNASDHLDDTCLRQQSGSCC